MPADHPADSDPGDHHRAALVGRLQQDVQRAQSYRVFALVAGLIGVALVALLLDLLGRIAARRS